MDAPLGWTTPAKTDLHNGRCEYGRHVRIIIDDISVDMNVVADDLPRIFHLSLVFLLLLLILSAYDTGSPDPRVLLSSLHTFSRRHSYPRLGYVPLTSRPLSR